MEEDFTKRRILQRRRRRSFVCDQEHASVCKFRRREESVNQNLGCLLPEEEEKEDFIIALNSELFIE